MAPSVSTYDRRTFLRATGSALAVAATAGVASADTADPNVETVGASNVTAHAATLEGDLENLGGADSATVFFEVEGGGESFTTDGQSLTGPGPFAERVGGLSPDLTRYDFRAVAYASDGDVDKGEWKFFYTQDTEL